MTADDIYIIFEKEHEIVTSSVHSLLKSFYIGALLTNDRSADLNTFWFPCGPDLPRIPAIS